MCAAFRYRRQAMSLEIALPMGKYVEPSKMTASTDYLENSPKAYTQAKSTVAVTSTIQALWMAPPKNPLTNTAFAREVLAQRCRNGLGTESMGLPSKLKALLDAACMPPSAAPAESKSSAPISTKYHKCGVEAWGD